MFFSAQVPSEPTSSDTQGCPPNFAGKFNFDAILKNKSAGALSNLQLKVETLTRGNLLLTSEGLVGGGERFAVPPLGDYADGVLTSSEAVDVPFTVCLKTFKRFRLLVDVLGEVTNDQ